MFCFFFVGSRESSNKMPHIIWCQFWLSNFKVIVYFNKSITRSVDIMYFMLAYTLLTSSAMSSGPFVWTTSQHFCWITTGKKLGYFDHMKSCAHVATININKHIIVFAKIIDNNTSAKDKNKSICIRSFVTFLYF